MKITFYGAAQNVTGSKHLIQSDGYNLLLDCGLFQGKRKISDQLNRNLGFAADSIDSVILSHAHADHCGLLPILYKQGYNGKVYCTPATAEIAKYIIMDSATIMEQDTAYYNAHLQPGDQPIAPLYTGIDTQAVIQNFTVVEYFKNTRQWKNLSPNIKFKFYDAGHILGSAMTVIEIKENGANKTVAFSGDLGQPNMPILNAPEHITEDIHTLIMECTYGGREHKPISEAIETLAATVKHTADQHSKLIVPAFSLGRTQELIYLLHKMNDEGQIPAVPIYIDSPLAQNFIEVFYKHLKDFNDQTWKDFGGNGRPFEFKNLHYVHSINESKALNGMTGPMIIIASSGMAEGGRILHHLKNNLGSEDNIILITGYQAENTLGRKLQEGITPVKIFNEDYEVRAKVITLSEFSAHADKNLLLEYVKNLRGLKNIFLVHGELNQAQAFKQELAKAMPGLNIQIPALCQSFEI